METISQPKKNAATFRIKKARHIEITLKKDVVKNLKDLQTRAEQQSLKT